MAGAAIHGAARKHAVVTGASQGLGRALIDAFLAREYAVSFCARRQERIEEILAEVQIRGLGDRICGVCADIESAADMAAFWKALPTRLGNVTVWINNAGYAGGGGKFTDLPDESLRHMLTTNLVGTAIACRVVPAGLHAQGAGARLVWLTRSRLFRRKVQRHIMPRNVRAQWAAEGGPDCSTQA